MYFRADISYSHFGRNILWGVTDIEYLGHNNVQKMRMKNEEQLLSRRSEFAEYGTVNSISDANSQPVTWCLSAWAKGAGGVLPWQTIGKKQAWQTGQQTALFYPHPEGPVPSVRLKAFTRGQQDVEYLTLLTVSTRKPRFIVADWLKNAAKTSELDTVTISDLWEIRNRIGEYLSRLAPPYKYSLTDAKPIEWNINELPDIGYVEVAPAVKPYKPDCDGF